jgi:hypothetical protein
MTMTHPRTGGMSASQIRHTLQAIDLLQPAVKLHHMNLEDQADVLEELERKGKSLSTITLRELSLVVQKQQRKAV